MSTRPYRLISVTLILCLLLSSSGVLTGCTASVQRSSCEFYDLFDTFTSLTVYGIEDERFEEVKKGLYDLLLSFHQETDIYHTYPSVHSLMALNEAAGDTPVEMTERQIDFLQFCLEAFEISNGTVNVMLGAVTRLWHDARDTSVLPDPVLLDEAGRHVSISCLSIDAGAGTAFITDPAASIDPGALAKGYAGRLAMEYLASRGVENYLLSLGGNICVHGEPKGTGRDHFIVGVQDPSSGDGVYSDTVDLTLGCVVTSGDYQRYMEIDGVRYHHIIDPSTLYPGTLHHSVTVICEDSAIADLLSTAIFLMDEASGLELAGRYGAEVIYEGKR